MTWVPPGGTTPPPAQPAVPAQPAPASVAPVATGAPVAPVVPRKPADTLVRTALIVGIVGGIIAGSLIGGIGTGLYNAAHPAPTYDPYEPYPVDPVDPADPAPQSGGDYSDLAEGEPDQPTAATPTLCPTACFDEESPADAILGDEVFSRWYLPTFKHVWKMTGDRTTADAALVDAWDDWNASGYSPDECFVTFSELPVVEPEGSTVGADFVAPLTEHSSELYSVTELTQWVRIFPDSASAEQYMATLDAGLDACTRYKDPNGYALDAVTREPALHSAANVAALGFVRSQGGIRYYVYDLQRGNMVIRSVAYSDGGISDDRFRPLMAQQATLLGDIIAP